MPSDQYNSEEYQVISFEDSQKNARNFTQAAHGMIYCLSDTLVFDSYKSRAAIMMQMRFDGILGFPGGLVDEGEIAVDALNREMVEEINLDLTKHSFTHSHHLASYINQDKKLVLHFYTQEVSLEQLKHIEMRSLESKEFGIEVFGIVRPPLYTMDDGFKGFPAFLSNQFAGNARNQLLYALKSKNILSQTEIEEAVKKIQMNS